MKYVDLFAGCGGLSLGVERAGGELLLAVEKSDMAARTFAHNLIRDASDMAEWQAYVGKPVEDQVRSGLLVKELSSLLEQDQLLEDIRVRELDLVVGGPPCQGFSLAGRRNPEDVRNKLPWEYLEFVGKTEPKAVVIENVVGMNQKFSSEEESSFVQLQVALAETGPGYVVQGMLVNAMHYGAPQHRPRLMIIGLRRDVAEQTGTTVTGDLWKSDFTDRLAQPLPDLVPRPTVRAEEVRTVATAIKDLSGSRNEANRDYAREMKNPAWGLKKRTGHPLNHVPRKHAERTKQRFHLYQYLVLAGLEPKMLSKASGLPLVEAEVFIKTQVVDAPIPAVAPDGEVLANSLDELTALILSLLTKKHSQKVLAWDKPARTVVTLPDDYVHPAEPRIFSVRELARFQGFPDDFEFLGKETTGAHRRRVEVPQYSQVGNAVSPWLSLAVGNNIARVLNLMQTGQ